MIIGPTEIKPVAASAAVSQTLSAALAGKVVEARLTLALADGLFRFSTPEGEIDLALPRSLPPGTKVTIAAQPGGGLELTVLNEEGAPAARPAPAAQQPALPPQIVDARPRGEVPKLPAGQPVEAKVVSNPDRGTVRVSVGGGEMDLALARPLPPGTTIRLVPQAEGGKVQVSLPAAPQEMAQRQPAQPAAEPAAPRAAPTLAPPRPQVFTSVPSGVPPELPAGRVIEARVATLPASQPGMVRFTSPHGEFELPLPKTFLPGTQMRVAPQPSGTFVVTVRPESAAPASASGSGAPTTLAAPRAITLPPGPALPNFPPGQMIEARVLTPAAANGMARLTSPAGDFDLPLPQNFSAGTLVRIAPQPNGALTLVPVNEQSAAAAKPAALPLAATPAEAVRQALTGAVARQDGMGNLFADLETVPARTDVPASVRKPTDALLQQRLPLESVLKPEALAKAFASSGIFAERILANLPPAASAPPDLKLALFVLRAALGSWTSGNTNPSVLTDLQVRTSPHNLPPSPGVPPGAQAPVEHASRNAANMQALSPEELAPRMMGEADAALARISLHQIASLPDERMAGRADAPDARWSCDIPVNVDGRTAMFGFVVERDGRHGAQEKEKRRWRVRAAIDLQETGAVEADVRLRGETVTAGLIAERRETAEMLEEALPLLRDGLQAAGFEVEALSVRVGKAAPQGPPGHFVDRTS